MANWVSGDYNSCLRCSLDPSPIARHPVSAMGGFGALCRGILTAMPLTVWTRWVHVKPLSEGRSTTHSTSTTSTATLSFCFGEPTMTPSIGETSEKSRPMPRMM